MCIRDSSEAFGESVGSLGSVERVDSEGVHVIFDKRSAAVRVPLEQLELVKEKTLAEVKKEKAARLE
eukprot:14707311-Alexandrium_andersonii.AAC.1